MKKFVIGAVVAVSLVAAGTAEAKPAQGSISIYGVAPINMKTQIGFGELFSDNAACEAKRKFKLVVVSGSTTKTVDKGRTSNEGGISGKVTSNEVSGSDGALFVVAKTKKCAKATGAFSQAVPKANGKAAANTVVQILGVDGVDKNGVFVGALFSGNRNCVSNRRVKLVADGKVLDSGTSTNDGTWALHLTKSEAQADAKIQVVAKKTSKCAGGKDTFQPMPPV